MTDQAKLRLSTVCAVVAIVLSIAAVVGIFTIRPHDWAGALVVLGAVLILVSNRLAISAKKAG